MKDLGRIGHGVGRALNDGPPSLPRPFDVPQGWIFSDQEIRIPFDHLDDDDIEAPLFNRKLENLFNHTYTTFILVKIS